MDGQIHEWMLWRNGNKVLTERIVNLTEHFKEWDMSDTDRVEVEKICKEKSSEFDGMYEIMKKMIESVDFRENVIDIIDKSLKEEKDDNKKDS